MISSYIKLGVCVRLIEDLFIGFTRDSTRDFGNCPLNTGPLHRCSTVGHFLHNFLFLPKPGDNTRFWRIFKVYYMTFNLSNFSFNLCTTLVLLYWVTWQDHAMPEFTCVLLMLKLKFICCLNHICVYLIGSVTTENLNVEGKREMMRYGIYVYPTL